MTFDEWWADKREKHLSTWYRYPEGCALAAWNASAARYVELVEAAQEITDNYDDGEGLDRQVNNLETALKAAAD